MLKSLKHEQVILASSAPWRSEVLSRLQIKHKAIKPRYIEPPFGDGSIEAHVQELAKGKAQSLERDFPNAILIGADQMCVLEHDVMGKPGSAEAARQQLAKLSGRKHRLVGGLCVI